MIGGGFIGSEVAAALTIGGLQGDAGLPGGRDRRAALPRRISPSPSTSSTASTASRCSPGELVDGGRAATATDSGARSQSGRTLEADAVVAGLGIEPATELAEAAGLDGRRTGSSSTSTAAPAAAATSSPPATSRASRRRCSGRRSASSTRTTRTATAARSARTWPARTSRTTHLPFFYSDLFELGYEAVGEVDSRRETRRRMGRAELRKGVVGYLDDGRPAARVPALVDMWGKVDAATALIAAGEPLDGEQLAALLG